MFIPVLVGLFVFTGVSPGLGAVYGPEAKRTLKGIPDTHPLEYLSALDRLDVGDTQSALMLAKKSASRFPSHEPGFVLTLRLLQNYESSDTALQWARKHLRETRNEILLNAVLETKTIRSDLKESLMRSSLQRSLTTKRSVLHLARRDLRGNGFKSVPETLEAGLKKYPEDEDLLYLKSRVLAERGHCTRAIRVVNSLLGKTPGRAKMHLLKARLIRTDRPERARFYYRRYRNLLDNPRSAQSLDDRQYRCSET